MQETITRRSLLASVLSTLGVSQLPPLSAKPAAELIHTTQWKMYADEDYSLETLRNVEWKRDGQRVHFLLTSSHGRKAGYTVDTWIILHKRLLWLMTKAIDRWTFDLATKVFEKKTGAVPKNIWSDLEISELESVARS